MSFFLVLLFEVLQNSYTSSNQQGGSGTNGSSASGFNSSNSGTGGSNSNSSSSTNQTAGGYGSSFSAQVLLYHFNILLLFNLFLLKIWGLE